jgi:hypothetical protein
VRLALVTKLVSSSASAALSDESMRSTRTGAGGEQSPRGGLGHYWARRGGRLPAPVCVETGRLQGEGGQADGGIRTLDPRFTPALGAETEGDRGASEGINALQFACSESRIGNGRIRPFST